MRRTHMASPVLICPQEKSPAPPGTKKLANAEALVVAIILMVTVPLFILIYGTFGVFFFQSLIEQFGHGY